MTKQYPHFESKVNHKLAAEVWFPQREGHGDIVLPLRQVGEESSAAPLVLFSIISAFPITCLVLWCIFSELRMDCCGKSAIYRDAAWKMPPLILMTLKHTTHPQGHERDALFQNVGAWDLLKHNHHPYAIWPERLFSQSLQPPETLLTEFLDTGLSAGAAG